MADISDINAAQSVKIIGSDPTGTETNPLEVTTKGARIDNSFSNGSNTRPSITNTSSTILAFNNNRKYALIINNSGQNVYLKFQDDAVVGEGIPLPSGTIFEISADNLWVGSINAIRGGGGTSVIDVFEGS